ncbi:hypothetical protein PIB30_109735, partial [Stylosanthes scabra]|nr:hypothetical protein [Stylosanthes scabra]
MFAHNRVNTLREMKKLILSHLSPKDGRENGHLSYRFQAITADNRLEYRPFWISEDNHVWMTFEVHKNIMEYKVMEFYAEVRHAGCSSSFYPLVLSTANAPSHVLTMDDVVMRDYNFGDDSDYEEESSYHSTKEEEEVPNTPRLDVP